MKPFTFTTTNRIHFGYGSLQSLPEEAARLGKHALLVAGGSSLRASGHLDNILNGLERGGLQATLFQGVEAEPSVDTLEKGIEVFRQAGCDLAVSVGGGSVMDIGKAVACLAVSDLGSLEHFEGEPIARPGFPNIALPTTSGTGSEVTKVSVLTEHKTRRKASIRHDAMMPSVAIVDPELTLSCPPSITASSGMDALCQALESYTSIGATPLTDAIALEAIRLTGKAIVRAVEDGQDRQAREEMALGSMMAGISLGNARLGLVHGIAHPVGVLYEVAHGTACALLLPHVIEFNMEVSQEKYACAARSLGLLEPREPVTSGPERLLDFVRTLNRRFNIPGQLRDVGADRKDFGHILKDGMASGSTKSNPRPIDETLFREALERMY